MGIMKTIGDSIDRVREWAWSETDTGKAFMKAFVAGWIDGWEYSCLIIGNIVCTIGAVAWILGIFNKNKEEEI